MTSALECINWEERLMKLKYNRRIALYGAGKYGENALKNIRDYLPHLKVICFIDDNKVRNSKAIDGVEILSLEEALGQGESFSILITNYYIRPVLEKMERYGFALEDVFFWEELLIEDIGKMELTENVEKLSQSYQNLADYQSKMIFRNMVEARDTKRLALLGRTCQSEQYFPEDIFLLGQDEVFVDAGAFDGDTILRFLDKTSFSYKYIYAFEPDIMNYNKMKERGFGSNIFLYNAGLYDENTELNFAANKGGSSNINVRGTDVIQAIKFDELELPNNQVTFVKMDIEGSELHALMGMAETIKKYKPKLAICIYHKFEDLWELPLYIKSLVPEYQLYIRNYTTYLDEIVLYAVVR